MEQLQAGFGKIDITPDFPIGLGGFGNSDTRISEKVEENIYLTCIAVKNEEETLLIFTADLLAMPLDFQRVQRKILAEETGIPEGNIFFGAIHSHSAPCMQLKATREWVASKILPAAQAALDDLAPAKLFAGKKEIKGMNFTRHYVTDKGERHSANTGIPKDAVLVGHSTKSDPELTLLKFEREGKKAIAMINWQAHCDSAGAIGKTSIAPSWAGRIRSKLEEKTGVLAAYFTGTSGNQTQNSKIEAEKHDLKWFEYGEKMGEYAAEVLEDEMVPVKGTKIRTIRTEIDAEPNTSDIHLYDDAIIALRMSAEGDKEGALAYCKAHGIYSLGTAKGIRARKRSEHRTAKFLEIAAFCIGDLGVVVNTNETFSDQGIFIKENTPFEHTFIITGNRGYLACREAYEYYAYEALGWSGYYVEGTAEKMAQAWLELLNKIHD